MDIHLFLDKGVLFSNCYIYNKYFNKSKELMLMNTFSLQLSSFLSLQSTAKLKIYNISATNNVNLKAKTA